MSYKKDFAMHFVIRLVIVLFATSIVFAEKINESPIICIYGGTSTQTLQKSAECGVDILFPSITWWKSNDWMGNWVEQAHQNNIKVYPSLAVGFDGRKDSLHEFAQNNPQYFEKDITGNAVNTSQNSNLSWGYPEVRRYKVQAIVDLVRESQCDGVLLDYIRFFGNSTGYSDVIVKEFKEKYGKNPFEISKDDPQWIKFRANYVTKFIAELRQSLKEIGEDLEIFVCVDPDPEKSLKNTMRDWSTWLDMELVDGVVTMIYERDTNNTLKAVLDTNEIVDNRVPHIPMIACWGGNLETPEMLLEGSIKCLKAGSNGVAFYRDDSINQLDLWKTIKDVRQLRAQKLNSQQINYILNAGFENDLENWSVGYGKGIEISTQKANTGQKSLEIDLTSNASIRQIIDRGFLKDRKGISVTVCLNTSEVSEDSSIAISLDTNYENTEENSYEIRIPITKEKGWHKVKAKLQIDDSAKLKFVDLRIRPHGGNGSIYIDDVAVALLNSVKNPDGVKSDILKMPLKNSENINVSRGQPVKGSSFWENGFDFDNAVDGDLSSEHSGRKAAWHSQRPAVNQWIKIYLPQPCLISRIRMLNSSAQYAYRTKDYKIEVSINDLDYKQVAKGILPNDGESWTEIKISPTPAKYIKFTGLTGYHPDYAVGLKEIEIY